MSRSRHLDPAPLPAPALAALAAVALAALAVAGCKHDDNDAGLKPPAVKVETAARRQVSPRVPVAGVLAPLPGRDVKVGALVAGRVDRVLVAEGDPVRVGQVLAHVEAEPLRQHVSEATAQREQAAAALANARAKLERTRRLFRDGIASKQEVDDVEAALVAAESGLKQAQASGGIAGVQLDRATLRAPIAGVVAAILVPAGQPVDGNGTPVIELADTAQLDLRAPVPASRIGEVAVGQHAALEVDSGGEVAGEVVAIAPLVDVATNTVVVRVRVPNPDGRLRGGLFAHGAILGKPVELVTVPHGALLPSDGGAAHDVAIIDAARKVSHRSLTLGADSGERVAVLRGLQPGERVIVAGGYALPDGTEVEIAP